MWKIVRMIVNWFVRPATFHARSMFETGRFRNWCIGKQIASGRHTVLVSSVGRHTIPPLPLHCRQPDNENRVRLRCRVASLAVSQSTKRSRVLLPSLSSLSLIQSYSGFADDVSLHPPTPFMIRVVRPTRTPPIAPSFDFVVLPTFKLSFALSFPLFLQSLKAECITVRSVSLRRRSVNDHAKRKYTDSTSFCLVSITFLK